MWPRMLTLAILVAFFVALPLGGTPTAGAAHAVVARGHTALPHDGGPRDGGPSDGSRRDGGGRDGGPQARGLRADGPLARGPRAARGSWSWPVTGPHPLARPYLAPPTPYAAGHRGIDIRAAAGSEVLAPDDGVVHFVGVVVDRPVLSIAHTGGVLSSFEPITSTLSAGDPVVRGEVIGHLTAGHCAEACLHLGARVDGEYVNPLLFLGGVPWSVLLPSG